ncbi:uncharacterized protein BXZ73DRAFT_41789 [Epithele typhae]|uniref:uncharacterized protein n=1 Tax=Epithele typhae TaxID=378194 RepID=UPI002007FE6F|nr:uncharacterized protein BXZ73DRAFT_41789 [Epithele typhae]KAH9941873.1 hypothetical protein BXZ73DRAFT_41789 [Epithele typhae]
MGNCLSAGDTASLRDLVRRPGAPPERQLSAADIRTGLSAVAKILNNKRRNVSIVAVGGAVNTVLLGTRPYTGDVDFFYRTKTRSQEVTDVLAAAEAVRNGLGLEASWLNNHTVVFVQEGTIGTMYEEAIQQNVVVFREHGLTVYAAPWRYALITKLDRVMKGAGRSYDMSDAVGYLSHLLQGRQGRVVTMADLEGWAREYALTPPTEEVVAGLAALYKAQTGRDGVVV